MVRTPSSYDGCLISLCKSLNEKNVKYMVVVGGMAIINAGLTRATADIDLFIDTSLSNMEKVRLALLYSPDKAVNELELTDVEDYTVVRIADEIVIDLMKYACGITYEEVVNQLIKLKLGMLKPFPSIDCFIR